MKKNVSSVCCRRVVLTFVLSLFFGSLLISCHSKDDDNPKVINNTPLSIEQPDGIYLSIQDLEGNNVLTPELARNISARGGKSHQNLQIELLPKQNLLKLKPEGPYIFPSKGPYDPFRAEPMPVVLQYQKQEIELLIYCDVLSRLCGKTSARIQGVLCEGRVYEAKAYEGLTEGDERAVVLSFVELSDHSGLYIRKS